VDLHWVLRAAGHLGPRQKDQRLIEDVFRSVGSRCQPVFKVTATNVESNSKLTILEAV
jgi:hypothetical protein